MLLCYVIFKLLTAFLESFSWNVADVTEITLVILKASIFVTKLSKGVQHEAWDNVSEKKPKENGINEIKSKASEFEFGHRLANDSRD